MPSVPIIGTDVGALSHLAGVGGNIFRSTDGGDTWASVRVIPNAYMIGRILEFAESPTGAATLYAFPEGSGASADFETSTDGTSWSAPGADQTVVEDAIVWNEVIIGTMPIARIIYSSDGIAWSNNFTVPDYIWAANYGRIQFVGVFMAPWGEPAVYFLARNDAGLNALFVLDFYARTAYEVPIGNQRHLHQGIVWQNQIILIDGYNVWSYDGQTVRDISFSKKGGGLPPNLAGKKIVRLIGGTDVLYATMVSAGGGTMQCLVYNGAGWSTLGPAVSTFVGPVAGIISQWSPATVDTARRIVWLGTDGYAVTTDPRRITLRLPDEGEIPIVGTDSFQDGPLHFETGWIDGGFREIAGALYSIHVDGYNLSASETVKVEYRLNNNEAASYTTLGTFTLTGQTLYFAAPAGLEFTTVQFRFTLDRGGTATKSPEVIAFVLQYDKRPELRTTWVLAVDVNRMIAQKTQVGGSNATIGNVWSALKTAWNVKTLIPFVIPSVESGLRVKIVDMPLSFDDFRAEVTGRGDVQITVVEPIVTQPTP